MLNVSNIYCCKKNPKQTGSHGYDISVVFNVTGQVPFVEFGRVKSSHMSLSTVFAQGVSEAGIKRLPLFQQSATTSVIIKVKKHKHEKVYIPQCIDGKTTAKETISTL